MEDYDAGVPTVTFLPSGLSIEVKEGTTVFNAAAKVEVPIASQCGGRCACALCRVTVVQGEALLSPVRWEEEQHMGNCFYLTRERLSCQLQVFGDVVVEVAEPERRDKPKSRYIPYALVRKREAMEKAEEMRRVRGESGGAGTRRSPPSGGGKEGQPAGEGKLTRSEKGAPGRRRRGRGGRGRRRGGANPGALRPGDTRPPEGAKKSSTAEEGGED